MGSNTVSTKQNNLNGSIKHTHTDTKHLIEPISSRILCFNTQLWSSLLWKRCIWRVNCVAYIKGWGELHPTAPFTTENVFHVISHGYYIGQRGVRTAPSYPWHR